MCCSNSNGQDLLNRLMSRGGCGGGCETASTCCDTPAPSCGGGRTCGIKLPSLGMRGNDDCGCGGACDGGCRLRSGCVRGLVSGLKRSGFAEGCGKRMGASDGGCGCDVPAPAPAPACGPSCPGDADSCGCGSGGLLGSGLMSGGGGLLGRLRGGNCDSGCDAPAGDCGCDVAPAPAPCAAPVSACGCDNAPSCGCSRNAGQRVSGLLSRLGNRGCGQCGSDSADCGCNVAPAPAPCAAPATSCGCDEAPACGCEKSGRSLNLGSRLGNICGRCGAKGGSCGCGSNRSPLRNVVSHMPRRNGGMRKLWCGSWFGLWLQRCTFKLWKWAFDSLGSSSRKSHPRGVTLLQLKRRLQSSMPKFRLPRWMR